MTADRPYPTNSEKRLPAWTDRILYATYTDSHDASGITPLIYTSIPSYTTSDHKPIVARLLLPAALPPSYSIPSISTTSVPLLPQPPQYMPDPYATPKRYTGKCLGRILGLLWTLMWLLGLGTAVFGVGNALLGLGAFMWWRKRNVEVV